MFLLVSGTPVVGFTGLGFPNFQAKGFKVPPKDCNRLAAEGLNFTVYIDEQRVRRLATNARALFNKSCMRVV